MLRIEFSGPFGEVVELFDKQEEFLTSKPTARFRLALAGRGGGKTFCGVIAAINELEKLKPGESICLVAPTYVMLNGILMPEFRKRYWHKKKSYNAIDRMFIDYKDRIVYLRSADRPDRIRGLHPHMMYLDEAGMMSEDMWNIANGCVSVRKGSIWLTTTPMFTNFWLQNRIWRNRHKDEYLFVTWESKENPSFDPEEFERLRKETDPRIFALEYMAQFGTISGLVWPQFDDDVHIDPELQYSHALPLYVSMDFGVNMPTFVGWYQVDPTIGKYGQIRKLGELWQTDMDFWAIMEKKIIPRFPKPPRWIACDPTGNYRDKVANISHGQILREYGRKYNFGVKFKKDWNSHEMRMHGITEVTKALIEEDGFKIHPSCIHTIETFKFYAYEKGTDKPEKDGIHDHPAEEMQYFFIAKPRRVLPRGEYDLVGHEEYFEGTGY